MLTDMAAVTFPVTATTDISIGTLAIFSTVAFMGLSVVRGFIRG